MNAVHFLPVDTDDRIGQRQYGILKTPNVALNEFDIGQRKIKLTLCQSQGLMGSWSKRTY
jgi:hypothetical protein